jgi:glutamine cyclotransferase
VPEISSLVRALLLSAVLAVLPRIVVAAAPPILHDGEAPQISRARVYDQTGIPVYTYEILKTYTHDTADYTEALFMHDGYLYEGTGQYGNSKLKKWNLATGEVLSERDLDPRYFGEGAVALRGKIYHLTYISNAGFIYADGDLTPKGTFEYPRQGWGVTTDGESLIVSDGSSAILFLNPETFEVERTIIVKDGYSEVGFLNTSSNMSMAKFTPMSGRSSTSCDSRLIPDRSPAGSTSTA